MIHNHETVTMHLTEHRQSQHPVEHLQLKKPDIFLRRKREKRQVNIVFTFVRRPGTQRQMNANVPP